MAKWRMIIDVEKCEDCNNCFLSCKDEHVDNDWPGYALAQPRHGHRWMNIMRKERGSFPLIDVAYRPTPCMHCESAPCARAAKNGAVYRREDGIVLIDPEKAAGQREIVKACPYGAIEIAATTNARVVNQDKCRGCKTCQGACPWAMTTFDTEANKASKCHLCGGDPQCVKACPTGALQYVPWADRTKEVPARFIPVSMQLPDDVKSTCAKCH